MFALVRAREQRETSKELDQDAAQRPHIDLLSVGEQTQHNVGCPIKPGLDIRVDDLVL